MVVWLSGTLIRLIAIKGLLVGRRIGWAGAEGIN